MIEINNVSKFYGAFQVLKDCNASIARGEVVVICGPSGSGKSTFIKTVNGLEAIDSGEAALVIVGETTIEDAIEKAQLKAQKKVAKELQVDKADVDQAVQEAAQSIS